MKLEKRSSFGWGASAAGYGPCKNGLVVHYDGSDKGLADKSHTSCRAYWKWCRSFHMKAKSKGGRGWSDIGYSFAVCPHGYVLEGRGWQRQQAAQPGGNSTWTSVTFMSGPTENPTAAQVNAFRELRAWLRGKGLAAAISYHSRFISTSCPGPILKDKVTSGALAGSPSKPSTPKPSPSATWTEDIVNELPTLRNGSSGEHVQSLQGLLNARSQKVTIDGRFGPATDKAVESVQRWGGVTPDGVVGPKTWPVLLRVHK